MISLFRCLKFLSVGVTEYTLDRPKVEQNGSGSIVSILCRLVENIRRVKAKHSHKLAEATIVLASNQHSSLHKFYCFLSQGVVQDACHQLEATLLGSSFRPTLLLRSLGLTTSYAATSWRTQCWKARIRQLFPELDRRSLLRIECPETFGKLTSSLLEIMRVSLTGHGL